MAANVEKPTAGGAYVRRPDGTLELVEATAPAEAEAETSEKPAGKRKPREEQ